MKKKVQDQPVSPRATVDQFEIFWDIYPNAQQKNKTRKLFLKQTRREAWRIIYAAMIYANAGRHWYPDEEYMKQPPSFIATSYHDCLDEEYAEFGEWFERHGEKELEGIYRIPGGPITENVFEYGSWRSGDAQDHILREWNSSYGRECFEKLANGKGLWPEAFWGPPPGHDHCLLTAEAIGGDQETVDRLLTTFWGLPIPFLHDRITEVATGRCPERLKQLRMRTQMQELRDMKERANEHALAEKARIAREFEALQGVIDNDAIHDGGWEP